MIWAIHFPLDALTSRRASPGEVGAGYWELLVARQASYLYGDSKEGTALYPSRTTPSLIVVSVLLLGLFGGCSSGGGDADARPAGRCPVFGFDPTAPRLDTSITLDAGSVRSGESFSGTVEFTNPGTEVVYYPFNGSVQVALLFLSGTATPVAVYNYTEPVTAAADGLAVPPGGSASLPLVGGTTPCGPDAPIRLAPGTYDVRFAMVAGLSNPVTLRVTD